MLEPVDGYLLRELANLRFKLRGMSTGLKAFDQQDKDKKQKQEIDRGLEAEQVGCGIHNAWKNALAVLQNDARTGIIFEV